MTGQFLVWRESRRLPIREDHIRAFEGIAHRLSLATTLAPPDGSFSTEMFAAHFPGVFEDYNEAQAMQAAMLVAQREFRAAIGESANAEFAWDDGWDGQTIAVKAGELLIDHDGVIDVSKAPIFDALENKKLTWNAAVVQRATDDPDASKAIIASWLDALRKHPQAEALRQAIERHQAALGKLNRGLNVIENHATINKARACPVCQGVS